MVNCWLQSPESPNTAGNEHPICRRLRHVEILTDKAEVVPGDHGWHDDVDVAVTDIEVVGHDNYDPKRALVGDVEKSQGDIPGVITSPDLSRMKLFVGFVTLTGSSAVSLQ